MAIKDGGYVFPFQPWDFRGFPSENVVPGVCRRDWLAGLAMQGIVSSISSEVEYQRLRALAGSMSVSQWIAKDAYKQADAMIAEGDKYDG